MNRLTDAELDNEPSHWLPESLGTLLVMAAIAAILTMPGWVK